MRSKCIQLLVEDNVSYIKSLNSRSFRAVSQLRNTPQAKMHERIWNYNIRILVKPMGDQSNGRFKNEKSYLTRAHAKQEDIHQVHHNPNF